MTTDLKETWEGRYNTGKTHWDRGNRSPQLLAWLESQALKPGRILVPGCGNGYEVLTLAATGFEVVALDIAPTPVKQLRAQLSKLKLEAQVVQGDLLHWHSDEAFDAIYEQTCLCALNPNYWRQYEQQLYGWLKPGGQLFTLLMQTEPNGGPPYHCELSVMKALFASKRWRWLGGGERVSHPSGMVELAYILERL